MAAKEKLQTNKNNTLMIVAIYAKDILQTNNKYSYDSSCGYSGHVFCPLALCNFSFVPHRRILPPPSAL